MVSKYEVLEYLRVHGGEKGQGKGQRDIKEFFQDKGMKAKDVNVQLQKLVNQNYVKKYVVETEHTPISVSEKEVEIPNSEFNVDALYRLTETAHKYLDDFDCDSFYELPQFRERYLPMLERNRDMEAPIPIE